MCSTIASRLTEREGDRSGRICTTVSEEENRAMAEFDSALWSALPPDIWERVLACLPERSLCRFRAVCKSWHSLLSTSTFRALRTALHRNDPTILVSNGHKTVAFYDRDLRRWNTLDLHFLRAAFASLGVKAFKIEAVHGSLLAAWSASRNEKVQAVVVCNPVAKTWRLLPSMAIHTAVRSVVHMTRDRLFVIGFSTHTSKQPLFQIYTASSDSWRLCSYPSRFSRPLSGVLFHDAFHALFYDILAQNHVLMAYTDAWSMVRVHFPRFFVTGELLVASSRLLLVTPCKETGGQPSRYVLGLEVAEIRIAEGECARVAEMPASAFSLLFGSSHRVSLDSWVAVVLHQSICFVSYLGHAVVHDEAADQWMPLVSYGISKGGQLFGSSFTVDVCMPV